MSIQIKLTAIQLLEEAAQRATGKSAQELRDQPIADLRRVVEAKTGRGLKFTINRLFIGRGSVMLDKIMSHDRVESLLTAALKE